MPRPDMTFIARATHHPIRTLVLCFIAWKTLLLLVAACSPGVAYDTSTSLVQPHGGTLSRNPIALVLGYISQKLTRWDAIYFTTIASRGYYLYEQEWAFGWGFTRLIAFFARDLKGTNLGTHAFLESFVAIAISHASHGLSVLALYSFTRAIFPSNDYTKKLAFLTALLHIVSPAGLFLSAPCGESTFALLSFAGFLLFSHGIAQNMDTTAVHDLALVGAGILLGLATTIRSNGILGGILFFEEALRVTLYLRKGIRFSFCRRLVAVGIGGCCIALGFLLPQYLAYQEYCNNPIVHDISEGRPWCKRNLPSIYTYVQEYYWNVGFLRYWTVSNIPLFLLAAPMLGILTISASSMLRVSTLGDSGMKSLTGIASEADDYSERTRRLLRSLSIPQLLLAVLAFFSYHVQIITRLSSGYPIWYIWLASNILDHCSTSSRPGKTGSAVWSAMKSVGTIRYMVVYGIVQAGLFASFLPPA